MKKETFYFLTSFIFVFIIYCITFGQKKDGIFKDSFTEDIIFDTPAPYFGWSSGETYIRSVAYNNDGSILASIGDNNENMFTITNPVIKLWDPLTGTLIKTLPGHKRRIDRIAFSSDGKYLASNDIDQYVKLWDVASGTLKRDLWLGPAVYFNPFAFSSDGKYLAYANTKQLIFYDIKGDSIFKTVTFEGYVITDICFSPDGKNMAVARFSNIPCIMEIYDLENWSSIWKWSIISGSNISSVKFSPDSKIVAFNGPDLAVHLFEANTGKSLCDVPIDSWSFCFSQDSKMIATTKSKGRGGILFWDVNSGTQIKNYVFDIDYPLSLAFSPDNRKIAAGSIGNEGIRINDLSYPNSVKTNGKPNNYSLSQNYPNPFNPSTTIKYSIPTASNVVIKIYNSLGMEIETLFNSTQQQGEYSINWTPKNLSSGIYFYCLQTDKFNEMKKILYIK